MAEYIPKNEDDDDFARPAAPDDHLRNPQPEPVPEPVPRRQSTQTTQLRDDYTLQEKLGKGAYGYVKKAEHRRRGLTIAVKIIKMEPGEDFSKVQNEIELMEQVSHSNIVAYIGSYLSIENMRFSICMEYCAGGSLEDNYRTKGHLSELQIAYVCREALKGLQYLHSQKIIHRDIKGANILLTDRGKVKLADFGVSAQLTETTRKRGTDAGTTHWMAPEMLNVGKNAGYNEKIDIWALGITSIELAECQPPNSNIGSSRLAVLMSRRGFEKPSLKEKEIWTENFHTFVNAALTKNPEKRPSAEKLLKYGFVTQRLSEDIGKRILSRNNIPKKR